MKRSAVRLTAVHALGIGGGSVGGQGNAPGGAGATSGVGGTDWGGDVGDFYSSDANRSGEAYQARKAAREAAREAAARRNQERARQRAEQQRQQKARAAMEKREEAKRAEEPGFWSRAYSKAKEAAKEDAGTAGLGVLGAIALGLNPFTAGGMILGKSLFGAAKDFAKTEAKGFAKGQIEAAKSRARGASLMEGRAVAPGRGMEGPATTALGSVFSGDAGVATPAEAPDAMEPTRTAASAAPARAAPVAAPTMTARAPGEPDAFTGAPGAYAAPPVAMAQPVWLQQMRALTQPLPETEEQRRRPQPPSILPYVFV